MNIPKTVKIGGSIWDIHFPYTFKERFDRYGQCIDATRQIQMTSVDDSGGKLPQSKVDTMFIHEIGHALDFFCGTKLFQGQEGEDKLEALANAVYALLVDNGWVKGEKK